LTTFEFNGVLADWKSKVDSYKAATIVTLSKSPADLTIRELVGGLRPAQLWGLLASLAALAAGAFTVGAKLVGHG